MKNVYFIFLFIIIQCNQKIIYKPLIIQFDFSCLLLRNSEILNLVKKEFSKAMYYINNLFYCKESDGLYKKISNLNTPYIICEDKAKYKIDKNNVDKNTYLLIITKIIINPENNKKNNDKYNNLIINQCIKKGDRPLVAILNFLFNSEKEMLQKIKKNFENLKYYWLIIRAIISLIGFNKQNLKKNNIQNNILGKNKKVLYKYSFYKSFLKLSLLTNYTFPKTKDIEKYIDFWPSIPKFDDLMKYPINLNEFNPSITEMTLNLIESIGYKNKNCELFYFDNLCYKVDQKCLNKFELESYITQFSIDDINKRWICYVNNEQNIKRNQCGNYYGILLTQKVFHKNELIDFLHNKDFQHLILLHPSVLCPKSHPRTIFFSSVKPKEDPYQFKYLDRIEEIILKDPNYFVITNADSNYYNVKLYTNNYNNIYSNSNMHWNYNIFWEKYPNPNHKGLSNKYNKYQLIGQFPSEITFKDGINKFYNILKDKFPKEYNYIPETYIFPDQKDEINEKFKNYEYNPFDAWLFKPSRDSFGNGIKIIDNFKIIQNSIYKNYLISRYIMNPMLINNKKFDIRVYILVTDMNPLKIYYYRDGYLKIPVKDFTLDYKYINDNCVHITTSDINLKCFNGKEYKYDTNIYDEKSNFWSFKLFEKYCDKNGINYTYIIEQIKDITIKTFISLNNEFIKLIKEKYQKDRKLFQLYGLDLLIDDKNKVYLLELNRNPSMRGGHAVADYIYENIIADILNIVGVVPFRHDFFQEPLDNNIYFYNNKIEEIVDDSLCEFSRPRGLFELIYPLKNNINKYDKFYENISPENLLLWDKLIESNGEYD